MSFSSTKNGRLVHLQDLVSIPNQNIRNNDVRQIMHHIQKGGTLPPVVVNRASNVVMDGNARLAAYKKLGMERIRAIYL